jgi:hypothetical protein
VQCRNGAGCTRRDCRYAHPDEDRANTLLAGLPNGSGAKAKLISNLKSVAEELPKLTPISHDEEACFAKYLSAPEATAPLSSVISLESPNTKIRGDCFDISTNAEGLWVLQVHVVDVSCIFQKPDMARLEQNARSALDSVYDGEHLQKIFSKASCEAASLTIGRARRVVTMRVVFDKAISEITSTTFQVGATTLTHTETFNSADNIIENADSTSPLASVLKTAHKMATLVHGEIPAGINAYAVEHSLRLGGDSVESSFSFRVGKSQRIHDAFHKLYNDAALRLLPADLTIVEVPQVCASKAQLTKLLETVLAIWPAGSNPPTPNRSSIATYLRRQTAGLLDERDILRAFDILPDDGTRYVILGSWLAEGGAADGSAPVVKATNPLRHYLCLYHQSILVQTIVRGAPLALPPLNLKDLCARVNQKKLEKEKIMAITQSTLATAQNDWITDWGVVTRIYEDDKPRVDVYFPNASFGPFLGERMKGVRVMRGKSVKVGNIGNVYIPKGDEGTPYFPLTDTPLPEEIRKKISF